MIERARAADASVVLHQVARDAGCIRRHLALDQHPQNHRFVVVQRLA